MILQLFLPLSILCFFQGVNAYDVDPYPSYRYREFYYLTDAQKAAAGKLGYTWETWNNPYTHLPFDKRSWYWNFGEGDYYDLDGDLDYYDGDNAEAKAAVETLGFVDTTYEGVSVPAADIWDCWVTHYSSYYWSELVLYDIASSYEALGWTEAMWDLSQGVPASSDKMYSELTYAEKTAALTVCYNQQLWDMEPLPHCEDSPGELTVLGITRSCDWVSGDLSRCDWDYGAPGQHCRNTCGTCGQTSSPAPTPAPTPAPVTQGPGSCTDSTTSFEASKPGPNGTVQWTKPKTCDKWVKAKSTAWRCWKVGGVKENCPRTCLNCCEDTTEAFTLKNGKEKRCTWVAKNPVERCKKPPARQLCAVTCGQCD